MAAPQYSMTNYFGTTDPAGDILTLIEAQLTNTEWQFVEQVTFTQASTGRLMRVWKNPSTLNAAGVDFYIGIVKNQTAGTYLAIRAFEGWNTSTKTMQRPVMGANTTQTTTWNCVAFGNGTFVVAESTATGYIATSTDGLTWTSRRLPAAVAISSITYGNGLFVATGGVTASTVAFTSPDGITWTQRVLPTNSTWSAVTYGNGTYVAIATGTAIAATSPDGITWTQRALPVSTTWKTIAYGNSTFVAIGQNSGITATSPDGITWTQRTITTATHTQVIYAGGQFVVVNATNSNVYTSPDAITWTARTMSGSPFYGITYTGTTYVAVGPTSTSASSADGINWTSRTLAYAGYTYQAIAYGAGVVAAFSNQVQVTQASLDNGTTWRQTYGAGAVSDTAFGDYQPSGATTPALCESTFPFSTNTSYDVAVLVSKSYLAVGINTNGTGSAVKGIVAGLYSPAYPDSVISNPPLMLLDLNGGPVNGQSGVSRAMRTPIDVSATFSICGSPESLTLGSWNSAIKEQVTQSIRGSRVALLAGTSSSYSTGYTNMTYPGGFRGWLYDCTAVATIGSGLKIADTITIGSTVSRAFATGQTLTSATGTYFGFFFNTAGNS